MQGVVSVPPPSLSAATNRHHQHRLWPLGGHWTTQFGPPRTGDPPKPELKPTTGVAPSGGWKTYQKLSLKAWFGFLPHFWPTPATKTFIGLLLLFRLRWYILYTTN